MSPEILQIIQEIETLGRQIKSSQDDEERAHYAARVLDLCWRWRSLTASPVERKRRKTSSRSLDIPEEWLLEGEGDQ